MKATESTILLWAVAAWLMVQTGCSRSSPSAAHPPTSVAGRVLSAAGAARLAAQLANEQCDRQYHTRPFAPEQHVAVLQKNTYQWGGLDVGGPQGFSAVVTFQADGTQPHVEVYFSSDALSR